MAQDDEMSDFFFAYFDNMYDIVVNILDLGITSARHAGSKALQALNGQGSACFPLRRPGQDFKAPRPPTLFPTSHVCLCCP